MSWYDESPDDLERAISSAARAGMSRLVALDGSYSQYPGGEASSPIEQLDAIETASQEAGVSLLVQRPVMRWPSEMAKRSHLFSLGDQLTASIPEEKLWFLILDADYEIRVNYRYALLDLLDGRSEWAADASMYMPLSVRLGRSGIPQRSKIRTLFRGKGIRVEGNHYTYRSLDGALLWGPPHAEWVPGVDLTEQVVVVHWTFQRSEARVARQEAYYIERDESGVERGPCEVCGVERSVCFMRKEIRQLSATEFDYRHIEVCRACLPGVAAELHAQALQHGIDADVMTQPVNVVRGAL